MDKQTRYFFIGIAIFLILWIAWGISRRIELEKHHLVTHGRIIDCTYDGKNNVFYVGYNFFLKQKLYKSSIALKYRNFKTSVLKQKLVGLEAPVVYDPDKPSLNALLIEREAFQRFKISIPDSLISITDFLYYGYSLK